MTTNEPTHTITFGLVEASIWEYRGTAKPSFDVTFDRLYKSLDQKSWTRFKGFGKDDLLSLAEAARAAFLWIHQQ